MLVSPIRIFTAFVVAAVAGVSAQDQCITNCLTQSQSAATCASYTNISCSCTNTVFQSTVAACLTANCTAADQASALALQQAECGSSSSNSSSTSGATPTSSSPSSSSSSASTPKSSSGAVHDQVPFLNSVIAFATVALGGAFLL